MVGEELVMCSGAADGSTHEMRMQKGDSDYSISRQRTLVPDVGARLIFSLECATISHS